MRFDRALYMAAYFSQNTVPQQSTCTCKHLWVFLRWPEAWIRWENSRRPVCSIIKATGQETTRTVFSFRPRSWQGLEHSVFQDFSWPPELLFQSDQGPDRGWNNWSFGILISLWQETTRTVISIRPRSWQGLEQSVLWDVNRSMIGDHQNCYFNRTKILTGVGTISLLGFQLVYDRRPPELLFQSDQRPDRGWSNQSLGILIGLWLETNGNAHHCQRICRYFSPAVDSYA